MSNSSHGSSPSGDGGPATMWQRLSQTLLHPPPPVSREDLDFSRMGDDEKRAYIIQVDPLERKIGLAASVLGVLLAIYAFVPPMVTKRVVPFTTVKPSGTSCPAGLSYVAKTNTCNGVYPASHYALYLGIALVLSAGIYFMVRIRRRAPLAFAMVMTGLAFGTLLILLPFGVGAGWIMLRAWRTQKYGSPTSRTAVPGWTAPPPKAGARRKRSTSSGSQKGNAGGGGSGRKPPEANKRYTPKTPPKPKKNAAR